MAHLFGFMSTDGKSLEHHLIHVIPLEKISARS